MTNSPSVWEIISHASLPVQFIMLLLLGLSIASWAIIFQKRKALNDQYQQAVAFESKFWSGIDLNQLYQEMSKMPSAASGMAQVFYSGFNEFLKIRQTPNPDADAIMEGTERAMRVSIGKTQLTMEKQLSFLATVASVSPYIGLLGTVWGIMNAFLSLSMETQVTLQTVAPDIAEALIATALGLFAAIPAVVAYNRFVQRVDLINALNGNFAEEFSGVLHRRVLNQAKTQSTDPA